MTTKKTTKAKAALNEESVADFLVENPDFLVRHTEVIERLLPPDRPLDEGVSDFQRYLVQRLKGQLENLRESRDELLQNGRINEINLGRIHGAVLRFVEAGSVAELGAIIRNEIPALCDVTAAVLGVEGLPMPNTAALADGQIESWLGPADTYLCSHAQPMPALFGGMSATIKSMAIMRLDLPKGFPDVVIAFGHADPEWFTPDQATDLIAFLAGVLSRRLAQVWVNPLA